MNGDADRLRAYAERGCDKAFEELVQRHVQLVYSVALRRVGGEHALAEDITQSVFLDLAKKAGSLPETVVLPGWLHRHACFVASSAIRREARRREREKKAGELTRQHTESSEPLSWVSPVLDEAIDKLSAADRAALVLRFYENCGFAEIARVLGVSEAAAQKRISRALEKLRQLLVRQRGGQLSSASLASFLSTQPLTAIPAHLATAIAASALAGAGTAGAATVFGQILAIATMTKIKNAAVGALVIGMAVPIGIQHRAISDLKSQNAALAAQTAQLIELEELRIENRKLKAAGARPEMPREDFLELLRLRGEVGLLRQKTNEMAQIQARAQRPAPNSPRAETQPSQVHSAKAVILDPRESVQKKLEALRVLRSADERSDDIVREMVLAYYGTADNSARADIFRQLHGVKTPELQRPLLEALSDPAAPADLKEEAVETLDAYRSDSNVVAWLEHVARNDANPKLREQAKESLRRP